MDQFEIASTYRTGAGKQPPNPENAPSRDHECGLRRSDTELESAVPPTDECGLRRSQSIRELPSRFKDYVM